MAQKNGPSIFLFLTEIGFDRPICFCEFLFYRSPHRPHDPTLRPTFFSTGYLLPMLQRFREEAKADLLSPQKKTPRKVVVFQRCFYFHPQNLREMIQFDVRIFFRWVASTTNYRPAFLRSKWKKQEQTVCTYCMFCRNKGHGKHSVTYRIIITFFLEKATDCFFS